MSQSDIINSRQIQWFPGHMTKTLRLMEKEIRNVDCVLQILDARIPLSSLNPEIERITAGKPHLYILNKVDLADPEITKQWLAYFKSAGAGCLAMDSKQRGRATAAKGPIEKELSALMARRRNRGMVGAAIRVMVVGIPNVGKSTFINKVAKKKSAKAGDRPGVTRGKQWVTVDQGLELLDTPGILWPKFEDETIGLHLAFTGAVRDAIMDVETLAFHLIELLARRKPQALTDRFKIVPQEGMTGWELLEAGARKRGFLISGGEVDLERMANILLDEFRGGKMGRITLEMPEDLERGADDDGTP